ncbi:MAG TPA: hypothetical protein VLA46_11965 [Saprospiraceae bacterium]|nr:hypothetical protein [Saprospiraceae bacterium]
MKHLFLFIALALWACNPDPPNIGNCDLNVFNGFSLSGKVELCNASGHQVSIPAQATLTVFDTIFRIQIEDTDPDINFSFIDSAIVKCVYWEGNENYELYENLHPNPRKIGILTTEGYYLRWDIRTDTCTESNNFDGFRK